MKPMNTRFFFYIFVFLTSMVLAYDLPPIVREALTKEELNNALEGKAALRNITQGDTKQLAQALGFALQNNKEKNPVLEQLCAKQTVTFAWGDKLANVSCFIVGAFVAYQFAFLRGYIQGQESLSMMQNKFSSSVPPQFMPPPMIPPPFQFIPHVVHCFIRASRESW